MDSADENTQNTENTENTENFDLYKKKLEENVKDYLNLDDEIKALTNAIKERKNKKKETSEYILCCMNKFEINHMNIHGGKLSYSVSKNKTVLNKANITNMLTKYFNDNIQANEVCSYLLNNREKVERVRLKRTHNKNK